MPPRTTHACPCQSCCSTEGSPIKEQHRMVNLFLASLSQEQRRWYAAIEATRLGPGGLSAVSQMTGLTPRTIRRGHRELVAAVAAGLPKVRAHLMRRSERNRGGRFTEEKYPEIESALEHLLQDEVAGNPMTEEKWVRKSLRQLARELSDQGYRVGRSTVQRLLKKMGFTLKVTVKRRKGIGPGPPERDEQFRYIASVKRQFVDAGLPVMSVDTKKKELIGNFRNNGRAWRKDADEVSGYDFRSLASDRAVPFGIYDVVRSKGYVYVGTSDDTPEFSVDVIARWWKEEGRIEYPSGEELLLLADGGGSNGCRCRAWKKHLQEKLCDAMGLTVTVCHYPPGCSKWNPIEHRLFSRISSNWAGKPLRTLATMLGYLRGTRTRTGLTVKAYLHEDTYKSGEKVPKQEMELLAVRCHEVCPQWNYTISPRTAAA